MSSSSNRKKIRTKKLSPAILAAIIGLIGTIIAALMGLIGSGINAYFSPVAAEERRLASLHATQTAEAIFTLQSATPMVIVQQTLIPSTEPIMTPNQDAISVNQWCVYVVPEGETIRKIVAKFSKGENPEFFKDQVFEATSGNEWNKVWYVNAWDLENLPATAQVALAFVKSINECTLDNPGILRDRPFNPNPTSTSTP